jgi:hypothetical protein
MIIYHPVHTVASARHFREEKYNSPSIPLAHCGMVTEKLCLFHMAAVPHFSVMAKKKCMVLIPGTTILKCDDILTWGICCKVLAFSYDCQ